MHFVFSGVLSHENVKQNSNFNIIYQELIELCSLIFVIFA